MEFEHGHLNEGEGFTVPESHESSSEKEAQKFVEQMASTPISKRIRGLLVDLSTNISTLREQREILLALNKTMQDIANFTQTSDEVESRVIVLDMLAYVRNLVRQPEVAVSMFVKILNEQQGKFKEQQKSEKEFEKQFEVLLLKYCEKVNEGRNGVIFKMDPKTIPPRVLAKLKERGLDLSSNPEQAAVKMLKVFDPTSVQHEFEMQDKAYKLSSSNSSADYAKIPRPWFVQNLTIRDPKTLEKMEKAGVLEKLSNGAKGSVERKVSVLMMDFIPGDDVATHLYKWILKKRNFGPEEIDRMSFVQIQRMVQDQLGFEKSKPGVSESEDFQVSTENGKKLYLFLRQKGFKLHPKFSEQVRNTIRMWHKNRFYHNDLHSRNIMVEGNIEEGSKVPPKVYMLDFGTADFSAAASNDDLAALISLEKSLSA